MNTQQVKVPFMDLKQQFTNLEQEISDAIWPLLRSASFIEGQPVANLEKEFAEYCGVREAVALDSGTAALHLALLALNICPGDEIICPANTFIATAAAIVAVGAKPVFVDSNPEHWQMDVATIERAIGPKCRAVVAVHLYGQPVEIHAIKDLCVRKRLFLIEDAAQAHGARVAGAPIGSFGDISCFSFYPGKNLGAFGDGGAAVTGSSSLAERMRRLRNHGRTTKYEHAEVGFNMRMDAIQAAVLSVKLPHLEAWNERRRHWAARYRGRLSGTPLVFPQPIADTVPVHHLFPVLAPDRDRLALHLRNCGIESGVHYPVPLHLQPAFRKLGHHAGDFPVAERIAARELSLPIFPEMTESQFDLVCDAICEHFCAANAHAGG